MSCSKKACSHKRCKIKFIIKTSKRLYSVSELFSFKVSLQIISLVHFFYLKKDTLSPQFYISGGLIALTASWLK